MPDLCEVWGLAPLRCPAPVAHGGPLLRAAGGGAEGAGGSSRARGALPDAAGVHAQLRDPGDPGDGYHHTAAHRGDQQGHSEGDGSRRAKELDFDLRRVLEDEDDEQDQQQERDAGGHPGGASPSDSWGAARGRGACLGCGCLGWFLVGSRGGRGLSS